MKKPIILIGGASGTGKSTLANDLSCHLKLDHRLGIGFVRAVVQTETTPERDPQLFSFTFRAADPIAHITWQSKRLHKAVMACIERARSEGTSLVIEGTHLLPELYKDVPVDLYLILKAPADEDHHTRLLGPTHAKRTISDSDWRNVQLINEYYVQEAKRHGIPTVTYDNNLDEIARLIS